VVTKINQKLEECVLTVGTNFNEIKFNSLYQFAGRLGCHQRPDRSFFIKGIQFPLCARCTGVFIGQITAILFFIFGYKPDLTLCIISSSIMFLDWFLQYKFNIESTNLRRLFTGFLGGIGLTGIYYLIAITLYIYICVIS